MYEIKTFECLVDEQNSISEVKKLRKDLATFNRPDCLHSIVKGIADRFGEKAICVGAPFESDHQMASLSYQDVIDYVATIDSDLLALGTNVVTDVKPNGSCKVYNYAESISNTLPNKFG